MLKKCVVIMALFALVTGAVFAQVTFGGQLQAGAVLLSGDNLKDSNVNFGGNDGGTYTNAKITALFGDGTAGGRIVYDHLDATGTDGAVGRFWGWLQWRPNQYFRVKVGSDEDGEWGFAQITGWGFTAEAKNGVGAISDYKGSYLPMTYRNAGLNYGAFDNSSGYSLGISVFPVDLLQINFLFKSNFNQAVEISERFANMHIIASYQIEEVGTIRFAAVGGGGLRKDANEGDDIGTLWLAFHSSELVQGLGFEIGGNFNLPHKDSDQMNAMHVAGGINLTSTDPFNLKVRFGSEFGGKTAQGKDVEKTAFSIGILPSYKLPKLTVFFHAGVVIEQANKDADAIYEWFVNPYIWVPIGGMRMWCGLQIIDEHNARPDEEGQISWKIPFGFNIYF